MLKTEFHLHTADDPIDTIPHTTLDAIDRTAALGYQALAITLHDRQLPLDDHLIGYARERGIVLIPGVERTLSGKHVLLLNFPEEAESLRNFDELRRLKAKSNGVVVAPHPFYPARCCLRRLMDTYADFIDVVEFNYFYTRTVDFNRPALRWASKHGRPVLANADVHRLSQLGRTFSLVEADPDVAAICDALRRGRIEIRTAPLSHVEAATYLASLLLNLPDMNPTSARDTARGAPALDLSLR